jgi:hypothetical protein
VKELGMPEETLTKFKRVVQTNSFIMITCTVIICTTIVLAAMIKSSQDATSNSELIKGMMESIDQKFSKLSKDIGDLRAQVMATKTVIETKDKK